MNNMMNTAVILADGDFPARNENRSILQKAGTVICCDGAAEKLHRFGRAPDAIVGDLDSFPKNLAPLYQARIVRVTEQETNDLAKAFRFALRHNFQKIIILGATGKREDHTLGNLAHLPDFTAAFQNVSIRTDYGEFTAALHSQDFQTVPGQQISIFSFDPDMPISSSGLKYPLREMKLKRWWQATLNEATQNTFSLSFPGPEPILVFQKFT